MSKIKKRMPRPKSVSYDESFLNALRDPIEAAAYLNAELQSGEIKYFLRALRLVAEAQGGVKKASELAKINRTSFYRMVSGQGNPTISNINAILKSANLKLAVIANFANKKIPLHY